jgi:hypothetical protein
VLLDNVVAMVSIDNGTTAPGAEQRRIRRDGGMADQVGPFDYHLTRKLIRLCEENGIRHQRDVFRYYRSDSASALEGGADVRTALITFGIDASHGYERIHMHALKSLAELTCLCVEPGRDHARHRRSWRARRLHRAADRAGAAQRGRSVFAQHIGDPAACVARPIVGSLSRHRSGQSGANGPAKIILLRAREQERQRSQKGRNRAGLGRQ